MPIKKSHKKAIVAGAGLAALAAAAAGVYMITGKNAKNRKKVAAWVNNMQGDVIKQLGQAKKASKVVYDQVVDEVAKNYKQMKRVSASDLASATAELKTHWDNIKTEFASASKKVKKAVSTVSAAKPAKKTVKKVAKKLPVKKSAAKKATKKRR